MKAGVKYRKGFMTILLVHGILCLTQLDAQDRFECSTAVWMLEETTDRLVRMRINPSNNAVQILNFIEDAGMQIDAIAFNPNDGLLYGLNAVSRELYVVDPTGRMDLVTVLDLPSSLRYEVLAFRKQGKQLVTVGSANSLDRQVVLVDMLDNYKTQSISITGNIYASDFEVDPLTDVLYGYNRLDQNIFSFDIEQLKFSSVAVAANPENTFQGVYFDSFGELYAFGTTAFGVASALFRIDRAAGLEQILTSGPEALMRDFATCPYRSDVRLEVNPKFSFPCNIIEYSCTISNSSGDVLEDMRLSGELPSGFRIIEIQRQGLGGDWNVGNYNFTVSGLSIPPGGTVFTTRVEIEDVFAGNYDASVSMDGLPVFLGVDVDSDNPVTVRQNDPTRIEVRRIEADSIFVSAFFCRDQEAILEAFPYGNNVQWQNGSTASTLSVSQAGIYMLEAQSGCETTTVVFDVTIASCPYNIDLNHEVLPDTLFPCSSSIFYFILDNDTGNTYENIDFTDTLPEGFEFAELLRNPFKGTLIEEDDNRIITMRDLEIPDGLDTLIFRVEVGDVNPGPYINQAVIRNFPPDLGNFRFSDYPHSPALDGTQITVLGVDSDTSFVDAVLCRGESVLLDGRPFGTEFLWENNSRESRLEVADPGMYELQVFSGCEISYVFYNVSYGPDIGVDIENEDILLRLGDSIRLEPRVYSENSVINYNWTDPQDTTMSCTDCLDPLVRPFFNNTYLFTADNDICSDSVHVRVIIDKTRRIYSPNIFIPGDPGINGRFVPVSPDFAFVEKFVIQDRWGNVVFEEARFLLEDNEVAWDGRKLYAPAPAGVYFWQARLRFLDGVRETYSGTVSLIK